MSLTLLDAPEAQKMATTDIATIRELLVKCTDAEREAIFRELRTTIGIHELENTFGAPAEVILEAIHRAPELTRRMLRGVVADAAFAQFIVPMLAKQGWKNVTPDGNHAFDHVLADEKGPITIQVKLQRSERGAPVVTTGTKFGLAKNMYMVEPQRTRGGKKRGAAEDDAADNKTRPYRYGEFDVLAVSLQPSTGNWTSFRYTVGNWLLPGKGPNEIATYQPVAMQPNADWTDDFATVAKWVRSGIAKRVTN